MPFMYDELAQLLKSVLRLFIKTVVIIAVLLLNLQDKQ